MEHEQQEQNTAPESGLRHSISRNSIGLGIFAMVTAGVIALTQLSVADRIEENERYARAKALFEIVPQDQIDNAILEDTVQVRDPELLAGTQPANAFIARKDGEIVAVILPAVAPNGYSGPIRLIVGVRPDGTLAGVRILSHKETPGLGDKVELKKSDWVLSFNGKSLQNPGTEGWAVKKDGGEFDQFTGATITPRAVVDAVHTTLQYFAQNKERLLQSATENDHG